MERLNNVLELMITKYPKMDMEYLKFFATYLQAIEDGVPGVTFKEFDMPDFKADEFENRTLAWFLVDHDVLVREYPDLDEFHDTMSDLYHEHLEQSGADQWSQRLLGTERNYMAWVMVLDPCL